MMCLPGLNGAADAHLTTSHKKWLAVLHGIFHSFDAMVGGLQFEMMPTLSIRIGR